MLDDISICNKSHINTDMHILVKCHSYVIIKDAGNSFFFDEKQM